jgi:hypothetical protein
MYQQCWMLFRTPVKTQDPVVERYVRAGIGYPSVGLQAEPLRPNGCGFAVAVEGARPRAARAGNHQLRWINSISDT